MALDCFRGFFSVKPTVLSISILLLSFLAQAEEKPEIKARSWGASLVRSRTNASTGFYRLSIGFQPEATNYVRIIHDIRITKALDESAHGLAQIRDDNHALTTFPPMNDSMNWIVSLQKDPSVDSHLIKLLQGEVDFYHPTIENKGIIVISNFVNQAGKLMINPDLEKDRIKIMVLTKATYDAWVAGRMNTNDSNGFETSRTIHVLNDLFRPESVEGPFPQDKRMGILIDDPRKLVESIVFSTADGHIISPSMAYNSPERNIFEFEDAIASNWQMKLYVSAPETIQTFSFELKDLRLK